MRVKRKIVATLLSVMLLMGMFVQPLSIVSASTDIDNADLQNEVKTVINAVIEEGKETQTVLLGSDISSVAFPDLNVTYEDESKDTLQATWTGEVNFNEVGTYVYTASLDEAKYSIGELVLPSFTLIIENAAPEPAPEPEPAPAPKKQIKAVTTVNPHSFTVDDDSTGFVFPKLDVTLSDETVESIEVTWTAKDIAFTDTLAEGVYVYSATLIGDTHELLEGVMLPDFTIEVKPAPIPDDTGDEKKEEEEADSGIADEAPPKQKAAPEPVTFTIIFDENANRILDEGEKKIEGLLEGATIDNIHPTIENWAYFRGNEYYDTFIFGEHGTEIDERDMRPDENNQVFLKPMWEVWFDADSNNEFDPTIDLILLVEHNEVVMRGEVGAPIEYMSPSPTGWKICGTDERFEFGIEKSVPPVETYVTKNLRLCPLFEIDIYLTDFKEPVGSYYTARDNAMAFGLVEMGATVSASTPTGYGGTIGEIVNGVGIESWGYSNFDGWYTSPTGGDKWIFGTDASATKVQQSHITSLYGEVGTVDAIVLYLRAERDVIVNFYDTDERTIIKSASVKEGSTMSSSTAAIGGGILGALTTGDGVSLGENKEFGGWKADAEYGGYKIWQFGVNGTVVESNYFTYEDDGSIYINLYPVTQEEGEKTVDFDLNGNGLISDSEEDYRKFVDTGKTLNASVIPSGYDDVFKWKDQNGEYFIFGDDVVEGTPVNENKILTPYYKVEFKDVDDKDAGVGVTNEAQTVKVNGNVTKPTNLPQDDRGEPDFWYLDENKDGIVQQDEIWDFDNIHDYTVEENIILTPFWGYTVAFDSEADGELDFNYYDSAIYVKANGTIDKGNENIPDYYEYYDRYEDWWIEVDLSDAKWIDKNGNEFIFTDTESEIIGTLVNEDKILTPHYKVEFKDNDGENATVGVANPSQFVKNNEKATEPTNKPQESKDMPNFWYIDANENGQADTGEKMWDFNNDVVTDNIVLTPSWNFAVSFDVDNDGIIDPDDGDVTIYVSSGGFVHEDNENIPTQIIWDDGVETYVPYEKWLDETGKEFILSGGTSDGTTVDRNYILHPPQDIYILFDDLTYSTFDEIWWGDFELLIYDYIQDSEGGTIGGDEISYKNSTKDSKVPIGEPLLYTGAGLDIEEGKVLKGWYTGKDGTGIKFEFGTTGTKLSISHTIDTGDGLFMTLHPYVIPDGHKVVGFDLDGDGNSDVNTTTPDGGTVGTDKIPTTETTPVKWLDENDDEFTFGDGGTKVTTDKLLTPVYTVKFEDGNGNIDTTVNTAQEKKAGELVDAPTDPTKGEPEFWYVDESGDGEGKYDESDKVWNFDTDKVTKNITLIPYFEHTVGFDLDGDGNPDAGNDVVVESGTPVTDEQVPGTTDTPKAWVDEEGNEVEIGTTPIIKDEVLRPKYTVKFEDGMGNVDGVGDTNPPKDKIAGEKVETPKNPTGGTIEFWYIDENNNGQYDEGVDKKWNFGTDVVDKNMTLVPEWTVEVGFDLDGDGTPDTGKDVTIEGGGILDDDDLPGTTTPPKGWVDEEGNKVEVGETPIEKDTVLTPLYEVSFEDGRGNIDGAGGTNPPREVEAGKTLTTPTNPKTDGTLEYWYVDTNNNGRPDAGETVWNFNEDKVTGNMTLTPHYEYDVSVNNTFNTTNNGSGSYSPGASVNINAGTRPNYSFTGWTVVTPAGVTVTLQNTSSTTTSFVMPEAGVIITANWRANTTTTTPPANEEFELTVEDGSGSGDYEEGENANVSHDETQTPEGQEFVGWDTDGDGEVDVTDEDFTFTMPGEDTVISPVYEDIEEEFDLTVEDGSGGGTYVPGTNVPVSHDETQTPEGQEFVGWDTDGDGEADVFEEDFTFVMPDENTIIRPVYQDVEDAGESYELTVNGGDGDGTYAPGENVNVTLGTVPPGQSFIGWDTDGDGEADVFDEDFVFVMPDEDTVITAIYEVSDGTDRPLIGGDGSVTIPSVGGGDGTPPDNVTVGGQELGDNDYSIGDNGEIILSPDFIATLPNGEHVIGVELGGEYYESTIIVDEGVALSATPFKAVGGAWSLFDLIMTVLAVLLAILYLAIRPKRNENQNEYARNHYQEEEKNRKRIVTSAGLFLFALFSVVLLILTQDFTQPMVVFDIWSVVFAVVALAQTIIMFFVRKKNDEEQTTQFNVK